MKSKLLKRAFGPSFAPLLRQPRYNAATEAAIRESRVIMSGKMAPKPYASTEAMFADLNQ